MTLTHAHPLENNSNNSYGALLLEIVLAFVGYETGHPLLDYRPPVDYRMRRCVGRRT